MHRERKLSALRRVLGHESWSKGAEVSFFCKSPWGCNGKHHKPKLQVNVESDIFHCWVCGWANHSLLPILALGGKEHEDYLEYKAEYDRTHGPAEQRTEKLYERVRLPNEFRPLCVPASSLYSRQAIGYLADRGITSDDILTYKLGYCESGKYAERIIIPSFDEYGELNFMVGRGIWERVFPPYLSGQFEKDIIFNDLLVDWSKPITLVEGPFDAIKAGTNAIALQGKYMGKKLMGKIMDKKARVYVAMDRDALDVSVKIAGQLMQWGVEASIVEYPAGRDDPGEMSKEEFERARERARPFRSSTDFIRFRAAHSGSLGEHP